MGILNIRSYCMIPSVYCMISWIKQFLAQIKRVISLKMIKKEHNILIRKKKRMRLFQLNEFCKCCEADIMNMNHDLYSWNLKH